MRNNSAQLIFLKYAYPCAGITLARGAISQKQYDQLEQAIKDNEALSWKTLEKAFVPAFKRLRLTATKFNRDLNDPDFIRDFFLKYHNQFIAANDGSYACAPGALKKLCRVQRGQIIKVGRDHYIVKIRQQLRPVAKLICQGAGVGDTVSVHYGYAVEKLKMKK